MYILRFFVAFVSHVRFVSLDNINELHVQNVVTEYVSLHVTGYMIGIDLGINDT